jgi:hypothetical protein
MLQSALHLLPLLRMMTRIGTHTNGPLMYFFNQATGMDVSLLPARRFLVNDFGFNDGIIVVTVAPFGRGG